MASKIRVYGEAQNRTALGIVHAYMKLNPDATLEDLRRAFPDTLAPDKGVTDIFVDSDFDDKGEHYFTEEEELVKTGDGRKVAVVKLWTKPSYNNMVKQAADYDIEVADFENQQQVGKKGSYYLEYVNGYDPAAVVVPETKTQRGCLSWLWILLGLLALILLIMLISKCGREKDTAVDEGTVTEIEVIEAAPDDAAAAAALDAESAAAGTAAVAADANANANATTADGASATATGAKTASAAVVSQLEKYQQQFDAVEYPVGEYKLKPEAKLILDNVAKLMKDNPGLKVAVNGYASREGNPDANQVLSDKRASTVVNYLISKGVAADRLKAAGYGTSNPVSSQLSPNRRIDFVAE